MSFPLLPIGSEILNHIIDCLSKKYSDKKVTFSDYIEPMFNNMIAIHQDYQTNLFEILQMIEASEGDTSEIRKSIIKKKFQLDHIRQLIASLRIARGSPFYYTCEKPKNRKEATTIFLSSIYDYFIIFYGNSYGEQMGSTCYAGLIDMLEMWAYGSITKEYLIDWLTSLIVVTLPEKWEIVADAYAQAKFRFLSIL